MYILKKSTRFHEAAMMIKDDRTSSYPYGTSAGKVCKKEMLSRLNIND